MWSHVCRVLQECHVTLYSPPGLNAELKNGEILFTFFPNPRRESWWDCFVTQVQFQRLIGVFTNLNNAPTLQYSWLNKKCGPTLQIITYCIATTPLYGRKNNHLVTILEGLASIVFIEDEYTILEHVISSLSKWHKKCIY